MADSSLSDVVAALEREGAPYYWMLLKRDAVGSPWQLHALLVEAFPRPSNGRSFHPFRCVYDHVVALAGRAAGQEIGDWLTRGRGEVVVGERAEQSHTYAFSLPPLLSPHVPTIHGHQIASHLTYGLDAVMEVKPPCHHLERSVSGHQATGTTAGSGERPSVAGPERWSARPLGLTSVRTRATATCGLRPPS